ncbi:hypothetical protein ACQ86G_25045 [Roseateles chitinivorans]|uniref:hypothetical protein n=1 Tax=Roseateles chitinivorans TaxID=2917965 RepID=UPI003D673531
MGYEIRGGRFEGRSLVVGGGEVFDRIDGGAEFQDCELKIVPTPRQRMNFEAQFSDCDVRATKPLSDGRFDDTRFERCRFKGQYKGCEFGPKFSGSKGSVRDCDFSEARLILSQFFDCSIDSQTWPDWPHIHLIFSEDLSWTEKLQDGDLPHVLSILLRLPRSTEVTQRSVVSIHLPSIGVDPEAAWPLLQDIPEIWFPSKANKPRQTAGLVTEAMTVARANAERREVSVRRLAIFHALHRAWIRSVHRLSFDLIELVVDCSFLKDRVSDAPGVLRVRLLEGTVHLRSSDDVREVDGALDRFMVMGAAEEDNLVVLKPHRKERGQILLSFRSSALVDEQGHPMEETAFLDVVRRYYGYD